MAFPLGNQLGVGRRRVTVRRHPPVDLETLDVRYVGRRERVRALWPTMSVRDIAIELDASVGAILNDARLLALPPRPASAQP